MLSSRSSSLISIHRDAWLEIDLSAIEQNVRVVKSWLNPNVNLMAVVKSDAYGHGSIALAPVLIAAGANWFGVASVDEGCQLRSLGINAPILLLSPCPSWAMSPAIEAKLDITVTSPAQVEDLAKAAERMNATAKVHLKVDTGMHRLGIAENQAQNTINAIANFNQLHLTGLYSHLSTPDDPEKTRQQNKCLENVVSQFNDHDRKPLLVHLASSMATRLFPETHHDMVRVGLFIYGLEPKSESKILAPAMSVRARINHLQEIAPGQAVGYGGTWTSSRHTRLASIPIGYGDGVDRQLSNRLIGLIRGQEIKQVGLISMDQMLFDVTDIEGLAEGDVITLIGNELPESAHAKTTLAGKTLSLASWSSMLHTITYELACRLRVRLPRIYTRHKSIQTC